MNPKLKALELAIQLYCCHKNGRGGGSGSGGEMTIGEIAGSLGIELENSYNLWELLEKIAERLLTMAGESA